MSTPNPDHSKRDYPFPVPYKFAPTPGQSAEATTGKQLRWIKMRESIYKAINRYALAAGLTTTEAKQIAKAAWLAPARDWCKHPETKKMTMGNLKGRVLLSAQHLIDEIVRRKRNPLPYEVSVAWRQKHDTA